MRKAQRVDPSKRHHRYPNDQASLSAPSLDYLHQYLSKNVLKAALPLTSVADDFNFLNLLLDNITDELLLIDAQGEIVYANEAAVRGLGYSRESLLKRNVSEFARRKITPEEWRESCLEPLKLSGESHTTQIERLVRGGKAQFVEVTSVYFPYNKKEYVLSVARDITVKRAIVDQLKESEGYYRVMCDRAADAIFAVDLKGYITYTNVAADLLIGAVAGESIGKHFKEFVYPSSMEKAYRCFRGGKKGISIREEMEARHVDGSPVAVEVNISPLYKEDQVYQICAVVRDARERKAKENRSLQQEKFKAMQELSEGALKEIAHPLQALLRQSQAIADKYKNREFEFIGYKEFSKIMEMISAINGEIKNCCDLTSKLFVSVTQPTATTCECNCNALIDEWRGAMQIQLKKMRVKLVMRLGENMPKTALACAELRQIIDQITANSLDAMPGGGMLKISTLVQDGYVNIIFKDTGIGITREQLPHIFDPFFTTHRSNTRKSAGLGLSIVHNIVQNAGGQITVESSLTDGTTVKILLPAIK